MAISGHSSQLSSLIFELKTSPSRGLKGFVHASLFFAVCFSKAELMPVPAMMYQFLLIAVQPK